MNTIIYYTNNVLDEEIFELCRKKLIEAAQDIPIISVSQKPMDLGKNICMGELGSSWLNLYKQLLRGCEEAETEFVATAEHDCLYTHEHFSWIPPRDDTFYYNENCYFLQWKGNHPELEGMYSTYWGERKALSQLICNRKLLIETINRRLDILDKDRDFLGRIAFLGEPGATELRLRKLQHRASSKDSRHLESMMKEFQDFLETEKADTFRNTIPNLDIRHGDNFTGPKRGKNRTFKLPYWGEFKNIWEMN